MGLQERFGTLNKSDDMANKKLIDTVVESQQAMKQQIIAEFKQLSEKEKLGLTLDDINEFVELLFDHSFTQDGGLKLESDMKEFIAGLKENN